MTNFDMYIGYNLRENAIDSSTLGRSQHEVWDKIFYGVEKASAEFSRESAPRNLRGFWEVVGCKLKVPVEKSSVI
jgi:hypothetical protein